ncbi:DUF3105 domain-containing protein [Salinibacterium sp. M195]|uniref:DUF3105 domain-containing protein n=1 Tax=Salinibacterium sp. M195 TaxID=2583374 RepID=UPI001C6347FE|nr:DUF3105 domain-containing protein [Salinibacterium sp. M195]QYH36257.1 DUF3105 domain-containing protein [Salinibacterium sp. M195]
MSPRDSQVSPNTPSGKDLTVKQQRDARRATKVAAMKKKQATEKRHRMIGIVISSVAAVGVLALVIVMVVTNGTPRTSPEAIEIDGVQNYPNLVATHVADAVDYEQSPPVGGEHSSAWLNCGVYTEPVQNENAVHALEHGAVWVTYNPEQVSGADLESLQDAVPSTYSVVSPVADLQSPVIISAWANQVELDGVDDPRLQDFVDKFWQGGEAPELGASCSGGIDGPGRIA